MKLTKGLFRPGVVAVLLVVVILQLASPIAVSAGEDEVFNSSKLPWRGSWFASVYLYAKAWSTATLEQTTMGVDTYLSKLLEDVYWVHLGPTTAEEDDTQYVEATHREFHPAGGTFTTYSRHFGEFRTGEDYSVYRWCGQPSWP